MTRALQLRREARMVSLAMGAAMMGTMYFLWARCAQHGRSASGGGLVGVSLRSYRTLLMTVINALVSVEHAPGTEAVCVGRLQRYRGVL